MTDTADAIRSRVQHDRHTLGVRGTRGLWTGLAVLLGSIWLVGFLARMGRKRRRRRELERAPRAPSLGHEAWSPQPVPGYDRIVP